MGIRCKTKPTLGKWHHLSHRNIHRHQHPSNIVALHQLVPPRLYTKNCLIISKYLLIKCIHPGIHHNTLVRQDKLNIIRPLQRGKTRPSR